MLIPLTATASLTLAAILTAILLPWALLTLRRSLSVSAMTLAMLGMVWRGESWKYACLEAEQSLLEQRQPRERPSVPKTASFDRGSDSVHGDLRLVLNQFRVVTNEYVARTAPHPARLRPPNGADLLTHCDARIIRLALSSGAFPARLPQLLHETPWLPQRHSFDGIPYDPLCNFQNQSEATPHHFI